MKTRIEVIVDVDALGRVSQPWTCQGLTKNTPKDEVERRVDMAYRIRSNLDQQMRPYKDIYKNNWDPMTNSFPGLR